MQKETAKKIIRAFDLTVIITILVILGLGLACFLYMTCFFKPTDSHVLKLLMPGKYTVYLDQPDYQLWIFNHWESKHVHGPALDEHHVDIWNRRTGLVRLEKVDPSWTETHEKTRNDGRFEYILTLNTTGRYQITCPEICVLTLVPGAAHYSNLGSNFAIDGIENDSDFIEPTH
jgi:hypothetical protein